MYYNSSNTHANNSSNSNDSYDDNPFPLMLKQPLISNVIFRGLKIQKTTFKREELFLSGHLIMNEEGFGIIRVYTKKYKRIRDALHLLGCDCFSYGFSKEFSKRIECV